MPRDQAEVEDELRKFRPGTRDGEEMWDVLKSELGFEKVVAVEV